MSVFVEHDNNYMQIKRQKEIAREKKFRENIKIMKRNNKPNFKSWFAKNLEKEAAIRMKYVNKEKRERSLLK